MGRNRKTIWSAADLQTEKPNQICLTNFNHCCQYQFRELGLYELILLLASYFSRRVQDQERAIIKLAPDIL